MPNPITMWPFEQKYVLPEEIDQGPIPHKQLTGLWLGLWGVLVGVLAVNHFWGYPPLLLSQTLFLAAIALVFARLAAIDMCYLVLLHVYVVPLFFIGFIYAVTMGGILWHQSLLGAGVSALIGLGIALLMHLSRGSSGEFGFGDVKMLAVLGAWVGLEALPFAFAIAFISNLILAFILPKTQAIPFGFGLVVGLWVMVAAQKPFMDFLFMLLG